MKEDSNKLKEYLIDCFGVWKYVDPELVARVVPSSEWVEIPEDAEFAMVRDGEFELRKGVETWYNNSWVHGGYTKSFFENEEGTDIVWGRNKPKDRDYEDKSVVNHPKHYVSDPCGVEAIEITSLLPACISNATKYIWREGKKDSSLQELEKALWYINYSIDNELPSTVNDLTDSIHFEELITKVKKNWSGWKYVFIDAIYWGDQQQMKRAIEGMICDINTN